MSRSGYNEDFDDEVYPVALWRGAVMQATIGKRGQEFFKALVEALEAMPEKRLIRHELQTEDGDVCAVGALGAARGIDMKCIDPKAADHVALTFNIAECLAREVVYFNDEVYWHETPEERWSRMRGWAQAQILFSGSENP